MTFYAVTACGFRSLHIFTLVESNNFTSPAFRRCNDCLHSTRSPHLCTTYTITLLQPTSVTESVFHLHDPSDQLRMELLLCNVHVRDRAFSIVGPRVWNNLPASLRQTVSAAAFKRQLKTYLYSCAFDSEL